VGPGSRPGECPEGVGAGGADQQARREHGEILRCEPPRLRPRPGRGGVGPEWPSECAN
jgi:hypothetical protein